MSGGHFDYNQGRIRDIYEIIQEEIENNGKEIPKNERYNDKEWYEKYPEDKYHRKYPNEILDEFKKAVILLKKAEVYTKRIDWYISGDDGEESFLSSLKKELSELKND